MRVFGQAPAAEDVEVELAVVDPQRFYGAFEGDRLVGTAGSFALTTTASWAPSWPASSRTSTRPTQRWLSPGAPPSVVRAPGWGRAGGAGRRAARAGVRRSEQLSESLYVRLADVAAALSSRRGTVQERSPGALARTSMAFGPVDRAPWCPMVFWATGLLGYWGWQTGHQNRLRPTMTWVRTCVPHRRHGRPSRR